MIHNSIERRQGIVRVTASWPRDNRARTEPVTVYAVWDDLAPSVRTAVRKHMDAIADILDTQVRCE